MFKKLILVLLLILTLNVVDVSACHRRERLRDRVTRNKPVKSTVLRGTCGIFGCK